MNSESKRKIHAAFWLWSLQCLMVLIACLVNPNHFTTIDSGYYLGSAQNILNGKGYTILENGHYTWNSLFPPGYSVLISSVAFLTSLPVLWASKLVNLLSSGIGIWQVQREFGSKKSLSIGGLLLLGPFLKLWCHTWSEPLFLILLLNWAHFFFSSTSRFTQTFLLGIALISVRYAGVFIIPLSFVVAIARYFKKRKNVVAPLVLGACWAGLFILLLTINNQYGGEYYGGRRFEFRDNPLEVTIHFMKGLLNELFLFRDTNWNDVNLLFSMGMLLQVLLWGLLSRHINQLPGTDYFQGVAFFYLFFLLLIRLFSPFDLPGYRLLSPFSFLVGFSLTNYLVDQPAIQKRIFIAIVLASWLQLLPENNLASKIGPTWKSIQFLIPAFHN